MHKFSPRSLDVLEDAHPALQLLAWEVLEVCDIAVLESHRSAERQNRLFREGKSLLEFPQSKHNAYPSHAIDVAPYVNGRIPWTDLKAFARMVGVFDAVAHRNGIQIRSGLDWDRDWDHEDQTFIDGPHIELLEIPDGRATSKFQSEVVAYRERQRRGDF